MIKAVFFDVDGTLLNTSEFIFQAFEDVFQLQNKLELTRKDVKKLAGQALEDCYECLIPEIEYEILRKQHLSFQMSHLHLVEIYPDTERTLLNLKEKDIKLVAITNRTKVSVHENLIAQNIYQLFDLILCVEDVEKLKPHPEPLFKAMKVKLFSK